MKRHGLINLPNSWSGLSKYVPNCAEPFEGTLPMFVSLASSTLCMLAERNLPRPIPTSNVLSCPTTCQAPVLRQCDGGTSLKHSRAGRFFLSQGGYRGGISIPFHSRAMPELISQSSCQKLRSAGRGSWNPPKFLDLRKETEPASHHSKSLHVSRIWEAGKFPFVSKGGTVAFCWYVRSDWPATRRGISRSTAISNHRFLGP